MRIIPFIVGICVASAASGADFDTHFSDSTLRLDYILGGDASGSHISLQKQSKSPCWAGRRHNMDKLPYTGNGQVTVVSKAPGDTLYRTS